MSDLEELLLLENKNLKQMLQRYELIILEIRAIVDDERHAPTYKVEHINEKLGKF